MRAYTNWKASGSSRYAAAPAFVVGAGSCFAGSSLYLKSSANNARMTSAPTAGSSQILSHSGKGLDNALSGWETTSPLGVNPWPAGLKTSMLAVPVSFAISLILPNADLPSASQRTAFPGAQADGSCITWNFTGTALGKL